MILLYVALLLLLGLAGWLLQGRVSRLEKRYSRFALEVDTLAKKPLPKLGNGREPDAIESARRQYQLVKLVENRDRLESRYEAWQKRHERVRAWLGGLKKWRGKTAPYLLGVTDAAALLLLLEHLGVINSLRLSPLLQLLSTWIAG